MVQRFWCVCRTKTGEILDKLGVIWTPYEKGKSAFGVCVCKRLGGRVSEWVNKWASDRTTERMNGKKSESKKATNVHVNVVRNVQTVEMLVSSGETRRWSWKTKRWLSLCQCAMHSCTGSLLAFVIPMCLTTTLERAVAIEMYALKLIWIVYISCCLSISGYIGKRVHSSWLDEMERSASACAYVWRCCVCLSSGFDDVVDNFVWWFAFVCGAALCLVVNRFVCMP